MDLGGSQLSHQTSAELRCRLCGGRCAQLYELGDSNYGVPGRFAVVLCGSCGQAQTALRRQGFWSEDYPVVYTADRDRWAPYLGFGWGIRRGIAQFAGSRAFFDATYLLENRPARLLDIGCGNGGYLWQMSRLGWHGTGIEPDGHAAAAAKARDLRVVNRDAIEGLHQLEGEAFEAITMIHVLEHLPNPGEVLRAARRLLASGGVLMTVVPNFDSPGRAIFREKWYPLDPPRHLWHFTRTTLTRLLNQCGYCETSVALDNRFDDVCQSVVNRLHPASHEGDRTRSRLGFMAALAAGVVNVTAAPIAVMLGLNVETAMALSARSQSGTG